ncbi:DUF3096 domain-containing protein [Methylomonas sp. EbA]|uniref:DUF3096 domain-containing protein n=1 Tax=Methylomonas albis TaxID=1854563 RepID=A0ABR9D053_9GAMM|nr:DUF3096 domain-containing protein [Methylomonas albis]
MIISPALLNYIIAIYLIII